MSNRNNKMRIYIYIYLYKCGSTHARKRIRRGREGPPPVYGLIPSTMITHAESTKNTKEKELVVVVVVGK